MCTPPSCYPAGGAEYLGDASCEQAAASNPNSVIVSAGDNIGATPLLSAAFHDEPTIEALNQIGLWPSPAVGNHEFDEGVDRAAAHAERWLSSGRRLPADGDPYNGADFQYLAANVVYKGTGKPMFPPYKIRSSPGVKVAFIGMTLKGTPLIVPRSASSTVNFLDEADDGQRLGRSSSARASTRSWSCSTKAAPSRLVYPAASTHAPASAAPSRDIVAQLDAVDTVISGHTHTSYNCMLPNSAAPNVPVSSAASLGRLFTDIDMTINRARPTSRPSISVNNEHRHARRDAGSGRHDGDRSPSTTRRSRADRQPGRRLDHRRHRPNANNAAGESALGDVIADAQLAYTPGGRRTDRLHEPGRHPSTI